MRKTWTLGFCLLGALLAMSIWAADKHSGHTGAMEHTGATDHTGSNGHNGASAAHASLNEGGQASFSALIEIVSYLEQNSDTDWANVSIADLREHLLDMNHLMMDSEASQSIEDAHTIRFDVRGTKKSIPSIQRMANAHSDFIEQSRNWAIDSESNENGVTITVTVKDAKSLSQLNALGFYGFMSLDSHHQAHHLQIALGQKH